PKHLKMFDAEGFDGLRMVEFAKGFEDLFAPVGHFPIDTLKGGDGAIETLGIDAPFTDKEGGGIEKPTEKILLLLVGKVRGEKLKEAIKSSLLGCTCIDRVFTGKADGVRL